MEDALLTKKSILNSFERITLEIDEIRRAKNKRNKHVYDDILGKSNLHKSKKFVVENVCISCGLDITNKPIITISLQMSHSTFVLTHY